jgi:hypothetical protein
MLLVAGQQAIRVAEQSITCCRTFRQLLFDNREKCPRMYG